MRRMISRCQWLEKAFTQGDLSMLLRVAVNDFCIPDFPAFKERIKQLYEQCSGCHQGHVANYIPQLAKVDPDLWAVSICTVDGQRVSYGDSTSPFTLQSASKPLSYALALTELGSEEVHKYVGYEPSGVPFNQISLNNRPHNPLINSGAIAVASLLQMNLSRPERFVYVHDKFSELAGRESLGFNNAVYLSERATADRNYAIAYYMRENGCFPQNSELDATMDLYFQMCSLESTCEAAAVIYGTLANGGINPLTGERILSTEAVRDTLSVMHSCGMYDYSGQFAFRVGLPAKSGVSGLIVLVIPNLMGIALWSPRINHQGNSVRGIHFCEKLIQNYVFHNYESQLHHRSKVDPRKQNLEDKTHAVVNLLFAASNNDVNALRRCMLAGYDLNMADYDGRTGLHVAASVGAFESVRFFLEVARVNPEPKDRWGHSPQSEAKLFGHHDHNEALTLANMHRGSCRTD
ncbi:unnamed protein product [Schistocephalus solidus]|uniref:glutaminase n=1 Tax=Schistocephalus solidus TaxID=70667 RepID=A0A183SMB7_SCHSO|nr:unnamed protein product [Schistocephalus solidus]